MIGKIAKQWNIIKTTGQIFTKFKKKLRCYISRPKLSISYSKNSYSILDQYLQSIKHTPINLDFTFELGNIQISKTKVWPFCSNF